MIGMPYLICFFSSCLLIWFGQKIKQGQSEFFRWFVYAIALLIPAALSGIRDFSVGWDSLYYAIPFFRDIITSPNLNAISLQWDGWIEPGYMWFNFIVAQFTDNVHWLFFWLSFLQNIFTFFGFYAYRNKLPIWLGMLCYYVLFFTPSLSLIRSSFAMSIFFFASKYLSNRSYMKYAIWLLVAFLFHKSALIAFLFIPIHIYVHKFENDRAKFILIAGVVISFLILYKNLNLILRFLQMDYLWRILTYLAESNIRLTGMIINFIIYIPPFAFFYWKRKKLYSLDKENHFFFMMTIISLLSSQLTFIGGDYAGRIELVFHMFLLLALPIALRGYNKQFLLKVFIVCYLFCFWGIMVVRRNPDIVIPYTSSILNSIF
jgi:hypothetical protein